MYHRRVGNIVVTSVSDGYLDAGMSSLQNIDPDEARNILSKQFRPARRASVNCFLIHSAGRIALIDTGCGTYLQSSAGKLLQNLQYAGVDPLDIDTVLLTHIHPDHSAGLSDRATGTPFFPNADIVLHEKELAYWSDETLREKIPPEDRTLFFDCVHEQIAPYKHKIRSFSGSENVFPGVTSWPLPGHTPGHSGFLIASEQEKLLIWGDLIHVPEIQVYRPEVTMTFDVNPVEAEKTRKELFEKASHHHFLIAGMHVDFPGFARVVKEDQTYGLLPEPWIYTL
ncbi:MBL fold metallo-hydrolase [Acetobacter orleanensis]|uniref:MBL fold metallo-hydrolase n=1 Tax=Acetobacter orleanensis TaxID=104099 RepID=UPI001FCD0ECF|nr:MBL fold metallo-hydrolase [Acetobacter orleanensis]